MALATPTRTVPLPAAGYVVLPGNDETVANLLAHGIAVERLERACTVKVERFVVEKVETAKTIFQGHVAVTATGHYEQVETELPAGAAYVDLRQPLARLIPVLLEPASTDSLLAWGFFSRSLVKQWSAEPGDYPVVRVAERPPVPLQVIRSE